MLSFPLRKVSIRLVSGGVGGGHANIPLALHNIDTRQGLDGI